MFKRMLLTPFSLLYGWIMALRNLLFDLGWLKSTRFDIPTLVVGNLNTGGSGKTPHVEYLLGLLGTRKTAVISRGYGRLTKGFRWVETDEAAALVGDEPLQIKRKFPATAVAVCEDRVLAVPHLLARYPETELVLFDDAFQHRYLNAHFRILLSAYGDLFYDDEILPLGSLRESRLGAGRADAVIVSKCPELSPEEQAGIREKMARYTAAPVYFSRFEPQTPRAAFSEKEIDLATLDSWKAQDVLLVSAIANQATWAIPHTPLFRSVSGKLLYRDHYRFRKSDIDKILQQWQTLGKPVILTTEKDYMRLLPFRELLEDLPVHYIPVNVVLTEPERLSRQIELLL